MKPKDRETTMEGRSFARDEMYVCAPHKIISNHATVEKEEKKNSAPNKPYKC